MMHLFLLAVNDLPEHELYMQCYIRSTLFCRAKSYFLREFCLFSHEEIRRLVIQKVNVTDVGNK